MIIPERPDLITARQKGLLLCHVCQKLQRENVDTDQLCQRCGEHLHFRHQGSESKTWALCAASAIFFVLANVYPIMTVVYFGKGSPDTILSGVITLVEMGMIPIALVVFIASIAVPMLKLLALVWLLLMVRFNFNMDARQCTQMYRLVVFIGRWSMLDLFVIAILVTLVDLGGIVTISGAPGVTYFSTVVVLTMFAAHTFDPRLIWDREELKREQ